MANGKRRANWEKVLEERIADANIDTSHAMTQLNLDLREKIADLQGDVCKINNKLVLLRNLLLLTAFVAGFAVSTAVLK